MTSDSAALPFIDDGAAADPATLGARIAALEAEVAALRGARGSAVFEAAPNPFLLVAADAPAFTIVDVNDAYARATMTRRENLIGRGLFEAFPDSPDDPAANGARNLRASLMRVLATRAPDRMAVQRCDIRRPDAAGGGFEERWWSPINVPVPGPDGGVACIIHHAEDVTRHENAREAPRENEERPSLIVEGAEDHAILTTDAAGRVASWSPNAEEIFGWTVAEIVGQPSAPIFTQEDRAAGVPDDEIGIARRDGRANDERWRPREDGGRVFMNASVRSVHDDPGVDRGFLKVARDETERWRTEATLRESEARFRTLADTMPQMIWSTRPDGFHDYYNARWYEFTGVPAGSTDGEAWNGMFHPDDQERAWARWRRSLATGEPYEIEYRLRRHDGVYRWTLGRALPLRDEAGAVVRWFGTCTDIDDAKQAAEVLARGRAELERLVEERTAALMREVEERRRAEEAMRQGEKLAAIGQLTGGIAHDFNNIVQVVTSGAALLRRPNLTEERRAAVLDGMAKAAQSAKALTGRLLAFARKQVLQPEPFDLNARLFGMSELLRHTLGSRIQVETDFAPDLPPVMADPSQLEVALLNLAVNARDAMLPEGGTLTMLTRAARLEATPERAAGEYLCVAVKDTGPGMPPAVLARVFEPFFTTKGPDKGTGLGLAQVHGFAKQSRGDVAVESAPGEGTTVALHLPRAAEAVRRGAPPAPAAAAVAGAAMRRAAGRTVLVVDDNPDVAAFAASMLEGLGYATRSAANAAEALALLDDAGEAVDAVFSDVVMPGEMNGARLAAALRRHRPRLALVLATGYSQALADWDGLAVAEVLGKPYCIDDLAAALDRAFAAVGTA